MFFPVWSHFTNSKWYNITKIESSHNICIWSRQSFFARYPILYHVAAWQVQKLTSMPTPSTCCFSPRCSPAFPLPFRLINKNHLKNLKQKYQLDTMGGIFANMYRTFAAAPPPRELMCLSLTIVKGSARAECQPDSVKRSVWYTPCIDFCRTPISLPSGQCHYYQCTNYIMHEESPSLQYLKHSKTWWHQNRQEFQFVVRQFWAACICDKLPCK